MYNQHAPQSTRCVDPDCGTRGGFIPDGYNRPKRTRGLCNTCYKRHTMNGTLEQFPLEPYHPAPKGYRYQPAIDLPHQPRQAVRRRLPSSRKAERETLIARRVARHESTGQAVAQPVGEGRDFDHMQRRRNAARTAAAWLASRAQTAEWDDPTLSESEAAKAERHAA